MIKSLFKILYKNVVLCQLYYPDPPDGLYIQVTVMVQSRTDDCPQKRRNGYQSLSISSNATFGFLLSATKNDSLDS